MPRGVPKLLVQPVEFGRPRPEHLAGAPVVQDRRANRKDLRQLLGELLGEGIGIVDEQDGAAESVQVLDILAARDRIQGPALGFVG